ncbi:MAG: hypothetical protein R6W73_05710 [Candidatus Saliniplasma sp.]
MRKPVSFRYLKPIIILAISLLVISSSSFVSEMGEASEDEVPTWVEGSYWSYNRTEGDEITLYTKTVGSDDEPIDIDGDIFECYMLNYTVIKGGDIDTETHFYTKDGLSLVAEINSDGVYAYNPTVNEIDFPLEAGKTWTSAAIRWEKPEEEGEYWEEGQRMDFDFEVEGKSQVEVPAGTFDAYLINMTIYEEEPEDKVDLHIHNYYSPEVENTIKIEEYEFGTLRGKEELEDFHLEESEEENDDDEVPFVGTGAIILMLAGSAIIYSFHKKFKEKDCR